jgi:antirestriction protein ArdC
MGGREVSDTIHRIVTDRMIAALERGTIPWRKPWHAEAGRPRSMSTGQPYRGVNVFLLGLTAAEEGYASPYWGTYRQISDLGGQVRKGEWSTLVIFWKQAERTEADPQTGEPATRRLPVLRYYRLFNAGQASDLPERFYPAPGQDTEIVEPQATLDRYVADGPKLQHVPGDRAAYNPAADTIQLPLRTQFRAPEHYYATAFHEAGHSTGHPQRLNRPGIADFDHFGSGKYAKEELIAQMTSSMLCAQTSIDTPEVFDESASYIAGWLHALNDDKRLVITAAAHAQRACDMVTQAEREPARESDRLPELGAVMYSHVPAEARALTADPLQRSRRPDERAAATHDSGELAGQPQMAAAAEPRPSATAAGSGEGRSLYFSLGAPMRPMDADATGRARAPTQTGDWQAEAD